jgi:hypothetical protein
VLTGGDLVLSAGDRENVWKQRLRSVTINSGNVYLRAGLASNTGNTAGNN